MFVNRINNVFLQKKNIVLLLVLIYLSACANYKDISDKGIKALNNNSVNEELYKSFDVKNDDKNAILFNEEKGRIAFIVGDRKTSIDGFNTALKIYNFNDESGALSNLSSNLAATTLASDEVLPYLGTSFERVLINLYQSLNYLSMGDINNSMVYVRAAEDAHKLAIAKREALVNKIDYEKQKNNISLKLPQEVVKDDKYLESLGKNLFLSAYVYYVSGNIREITGDKAGALVDYKRAFELYNKNTFITDDLLRLSKSYDVTTYNAILKQANISNVNNEIFNNYEQANTVLVIYERGFIPKKDQTSITLALNGNFYKMALPVYKYQQPLRNNNTKVSLIGGSGSEVSAGRLEEVGNLYNMVRNALKEEYVGIVARQTSRIITKASTQSILTNISNNTDQPAFELAGKLFGLGSALMENADRRSFTTLPEYIDVAKLSSLQSINSVSIFTGGKNINIENINLIGGEFAIIIVNDMGYSVYKNVIYKGKKS